MSCHELQFWNNKWQRLAETLTKSHENWKHRKEAKEMQPMWLYIRLAKISEKTFENAQWRNSNKCSQCNYASYQAVDLMRHLTTHSEQKQRDVIWGDLWWHTVQKKQNKFSYETDQEHKSKLYVCSLKTKKRKSTHRCASPSTLLFCCYICIYWKKYLSKDLDDIHISHDESWWDINISRRILMRC